MGRGASGADGGQTAAPAPRRSSLNWDEPYAKALGRRRHPEHGDVGASIDTYWREGVSFELASGAAPFDLYTGRVFDEHQVFHPQGEFWIGADRPVPNRRLTNSALEALTPEQITDVFVRYSNGDYGSGEAGFAVYELGEVKVYLVDDATRTLEGEPPGRDPATSPGPQTLMLPSDY
jgi:hypothetical protein